MARSQTASRKTAAAKAPVARPAPAPRPAAKLFAVTLSRGTAWNGELPMEQQADWEAHAG